MSFQLIDSAYATTTTATTAATTAAAPANANPGFMSGIMIVLFVAFMYFAIIRPQNKRAREQRDLMAALNKGDEVITSGGLLGRITKVSDDFITVSIAEGVNIHVQKQAVISILPKGTLKSIESKA